MKRLIILRHAKSGWDVPVARDYDRPINDRGQRASVAMGEYVKQTGLQIDSIVASPAIRVSETLDLFVPAAGLTLETHWDRRIYLASSASLIEVLHDIPDHADNVMMAGHNPGLEDLILELVPDDGTSAARDIVEDQFPTAAIAVLDIPVDRWTDVGKPVAALTTLTRPRDIDPSLAGKSGD
jgi:phosphohistidine phosphatase